MFLDHTFIMKLIWDARCHWAIDASNAANTVIVEIFQDISLEAWTSQSVSFDMKDRYLRLANFLPTIAVAMAQVVHHINIVDMYKAHTHNIIRVWFLSANGFVGKWTNNCCMWNQRHVRDQKSPTTKDFWLHQCFLSQKIKTKEKKEPWHTSPISQLKTNDNQLKIIQLLKFASQCFYFKTTHKKTQKTQVKLRL